MSQHSSLDEEKLYDYHKHNLVYISDYIKFADSKSGILLTLNVTVILFLIKALKEFSFPIKDLFGATKGLLIILALGILLYSALKFVLVLFPRFPRDKVYFMSWGGIASFTVDEYIDKMTNISTEQFLKEMAKQNHDLSRVCTKKYEKLKRGTICFVVGIVLCGISYILS